MNNKKLLIPLLATGAFAAGGAATIAGAAASSSHPSATLRPEGLYGH
jgi:hypothetical protein